MRQLSNFPMASTALISETSALRLVSRLNPFLDCLSVSDLFPGSKELFYHLSYDCVSTCMILLGINSIDKHILLQLSELVGTPDYAGMCLFIISI